MMKLVAFLLLSILAVLCAGRLDKAKDPRCPKNEVAKVHHCYGACTEFTCDDYRRHYGRAHILCIFLLKCSGRPYDCVCKEGYLRNRKGICIPRDQCEFLQNRPR
ncbi:unnamed protein product [Callosobruchus maculatus]|uniref:TIL domain-containing protein n=1 Tax=Callosobruchus maculatus TaxID=64391 RepID=A0A653DMV6_CALMS|nr:unnamed protein product [Callosobruchus maculatus]